jgi:hypothetical protein
MTNRSKIIERYLKDQRESGIILAAEASTDVGEICTVHDISEE